MGQGHFQQSSPVAQYFNIVKREASHIPCSWLAVFTSEALAAALHMTWAICHLNLNKDKQQLPVLLHFHFSRERIALAGAKNAKALAWNRGNLVEKERRDADILWGHCSGWLLKPPFTEFQNWEIGGFLTKNPKPNQRNTKTSQAKDTPPPAWKLSAR